MAIIKNKYCDIKMQNLLQTIRNLVDPETILCYAIQQKNQNLILEILNDIKHDYIRNELIVKLMKYEETKNYSIEFFRDLLYIIKHHGEMYPCILKVLQKTKFSDVPAFSPNTYYSTTNIYDTIYLSYLMKTDFNKFLSKLSKITCAFRTLIIPPIKTLKCTHSTMYYELNKYDMFLTIYEKSQRQIANNLIFTVKINLNNKLHIRELYSEEYYKSGEFKQKLRAKDFNRD